MNSYRLYYRGFIIIFNYNSYEQSDKLKQIRSLKVKCETLICEIILFHIENVKNAAEKIIQFFHYSN